MSEYRVSYYEPGLGWCTYQDPYPHGTVYRHFDEGLTAATKCRNELDRSVRVWSCGADEIKLVHEILRLDEKAR